MCSKYRYGLHEVWQTSRHWLLISVSVRSKHSLKPGIREKYIFMLHLNYLYQLLINIMLVLNERHSKMYNLFDDKLAWLYILGVSLFLSSGWKKKKLLSLRMDVLNIRIRFTCLFLIYFLTIWSSTHLINFKTAAKSWRPWGILFSLVIFVRCHFCIRNF